MKKEEFLKELSEKLSILNEDEVKDILEEYSEHIDEKKKTKKKEEKIIEEFGDIDELANEILKAYKINDNYQKNEFNEKAKKYFNGFEEIITKFVKKLTTSSFGEIIKFIIELIIICLLISLVKIPFNFIENCFISVFENFLEPFNQIFSTLFTFIIEILYIIVAFCMFITIFKERYIDNERTVLNDEIIPESKRKNTKTVKVNNSKKETNSRSAFDTLSNIMFVICKIILGFIALPFIFTCVGSIVGLVVAILFSIEYTLVLGICVFFVGLILGHIWLITIMYNFIFNRDIKGKTLFVTFILSLVFMGIGVGYSVLEFSSFNYLELNSLNYSKKEFVYDLNNYSNENKLFIGCHDCETDVVIDNALNDNIKIEVEYYDEIVELNLRTYEYQNEIYIYPNLIDKDTIKFMLDNLKNKNVYDLTNLKVSIKVYVSDSNRNRIYVEN